MKRVIDFLTLCASTSTLICCALPTLLVSIGLGASLAGLVSATPQLIWFSEHKVLLFSGAGIMLAISGILQRRAWRSPCPTDARLAVACASSRRWSRWMYATSLLIYVTGVFFAFVVPRM